MSFNKTESQPIKTILVITLGLIALYFYTNLQVLLKISFFIGVLGLISNYFAGKIDYLWMKLAWLLSIIVPNIVLSIFFFLFLTPIALLSNIFGKKNQLSIKNTENSLFIEYGKKIDKKSFENPW